MNLTHEDSLRLNVLMSAALTVRIDEAAMCVQGLSCTAKRRVDLKPTGDPDRDLRVVRKNLAASAIATKP